MSNKRMRCGMRRKIQIFSVLVFLTVLCMTSVLPVSATEAVQAELDTVYNMPVESNGWANWPQGPGTYGESAIIMEAGSGAILYAKNIDGHEYPASITKILTALVALENGELTDTVTFSHDSVAFLQPGDSSIGMKEGNQISLDQALHATLLASANEAAYAVGESVGINAGHDYNWFIEQMNARCKELGGENSNFVNTNGLHDENHYTCARDMALIGKELFKHPEFFDIVQTLQYKIEASETTEEHVFQQKHKMLLPSCSQYYEYAIGGKTGYTSDALSTLVTMADDGNLKLICVVLRTHGSNHYLDTRALFDYSYANFHKIPVAESEKSKDISEIMEEDNGGYVVVPQGVEFEDLTMKLEPDGDTSDEATLNYYYEETPVGSVRAKLSEEYIKAHSIQVEDTKQEKADKTDKNEKSLLEKVIIIIAVIILLILLRAFIVVTIRRKRKRNRRKNRRRRRR